MMHEEFNQFCKHLPATTYVVQWNNSHVWKVGGKVFAIGSLGSDKRPAFTFKTSQLNFDFLSDHPGYKPAPYFASRGMKWIQHFNSTPQTDEELGYYIKASYRIVVLGLTKKIQKQLAIDSI
jgi:predicted DNA-binding protein (MmcQ/YjbR family)